MVVLKCYSGFLHIQTYFRSTILKFEISRPLAACCNLLSYDPFLDVQWPQRRYIQLSRN